MYRMDPFTKNFSLFHLFVSIPRYSLKEKDDRINLLVFCYEYYLQPSFGIPTRHAILKQAYTCVSVSDFIEYFEFLYANNKQIRVLFDEIE